MPRVRNRAQFLQHFGSLPSSFSHTYLRHSVSAQADCCPDVVARLLCSAAPFITANVQSPTQTCPALFGRIRLFWPSTYTVPSLLLGYTPLLNQAPVSVFLKPVLKKLELQTFFYKHCYLSLPFLFSFFSLLFVYMSVLIRFYPASAAERTCWVVSCGLCAEGVNVGGGGRGPNR